MWPNSDSNELQLQKFHFSGDMNGEKLALDVDGLKSETSVIEVGAYATDQQFFSTISVKCFGKNNFM
jgi:hypothetical protein